MSETILLSGIVGSTAYGMATPESDIDRLGLYAEPTSRFHGIHLPVDKKATKTTTKPDMAMHEARKYVRLSLAGNPTVMELMWLESYELRTDLGDALIDIRTTFLSRPRVKSAYLGYVDQQFQRLSNRAKFPDVPVNRIAKHARHMARLVEQGTHLYRTGELPIRVQDPDAIRQFGEQVADDDVRAAQAMLERAERDFNGPSPLPEQADETAAEAWLQRVRREMWKEETWV